MALQQPDDLVLNVTYDQLAEAMCEDAGNIYLYYPRDIYGLTRLSPKSKRAASSSPTSGPPAPKGCPIVGSCCTRCGMLPFQS